MFSSATKSAAQGGGYNLTKSLRFRRSASATLKRTPTVAGNGQKWTMSYWIKRGQLTVQQTVFDANNPSGSSDSAIFHNYLESTDSISVGGAIWTLSTSAVLRDPAAWYHVVFAVDTTQATDTNRVKIYINNVQQTSFSYTAYPAQNLVMPVNQIGEQAFGYRIGVADRYFDGYLTNVQLIDGQQLTPSSFGSTNATTGVWQPAPYTGTYGTNGFYLPFTNTTSTTTLGYDSSGNGNNWTPNNISLTAGSTYDSMTDVPTLTSATTANYCVLNPLWYGSGATITNGNLLFTSSGASGVGGTIASLKSGKWYYETNLVSAASTFWTGFISDAYATNDNNWAYSTSVLMYSNSGTKGDSSAYGASYAPGDVIGIALDLNGGTITFYKNGVSQGVAFSSITASAGWRPMTSAGSSCSAAINFGQQPFAYTPPTGYKALNTYNLPDSTIVKGNKYMDANVVTGNGSTQSIVNAGAFKPDLVWSKGRNYVVNNVLNDSVRGISKFLFSDTNSAQLTNTGFGVTSFNSNGYTAVDDSGGSYGVNGNTKIYEGWQWQAGAGTTSSNTNGSVTSTVSVNPTAGFSVATFNAGAAGAKTVGHGLGVTPNFVLLKSVTSAVDWVTYHSSAISNVNTYLVLNTNNPPVTATGVWGSTLPTSSVVGFGSNIACFANDNMVMYSWAAVPGFSAFGSYTGNASTDGPFIYTGFRPKYVLWKNASAVQGWGVTDSSMAPYNLINTYLTPSSNQSDGTTYAPMDFLSNGFKLRGNDAFINGSGNTMIYMAFAENPFKNALAR